MDKILAAKDQNPIYQLSFKYISYQLNHHDDESYCNTWSYGNNSALRMDSLLNIDMPEGKKRPTLKCNLKTLSSHNPLVKQASRFCYPNDIYLY